MHIYGLKSCSLKEMQSIVAKQTCTIERVDGGLAHGPGGLGVGITIVPTYLAREEKGDVPGSRSDLSAKMQVWMSASSTVFS